MIHAMFSPVAIFDPFGLLSPSSPGEYFRGEAFLLHRPRQILDVALKKS